MVTDPFVYVDRDSWPAESTGQSMSCLKKTQVWPSIGLQWNSQNNILHFLSSQPSYIHKKIPLLHHEINRAMSGFSMFKFTSNIFQNVITDETLRSNLSPHQCWNMNRNKIMEQQCQINSMVLHTDTH